MTDEYMTTTSSSSRSSASSRRIGCGSPAHRARLSPSSSATATMTDTATSGRCAPQPSSPTWPRRSSITTRRRRGSSAQASSKPIRPRPTPIRRNCAGPIEHRCGQARRRGRAPEPGHEQLEGRRTSAHRAAAPRAGPDRPGQAGRCHQDAAEDKPGTFARQFHDVRGDASTPRRT